MPPLPQPRGGQGRWRGQEKGFCLCAAETLHQARSIEECVDLVGELFDFKRNLDGLSDIASFAADLGRPCKTPSLIKRSPMNVICVIRQVSRVAGSMAPPFPVTDALPRAEVQPKAE